MAARYVVKLFLEEKVTKPCSSSGGSLQSATESQHRRGVEAGLFLGVSSQWACNDGLWHVTMVL